jgi:O-acetyl-ADP-ribose deacetylase (regulator of RNase III)
MPLLNYIGESIILAYKELSGNIFNSKADVLINTVNCVGVMGKGIALEYRRRYPNMFEEYKWFCENGNLKPGQILPYRKQAPWIFNFAIKNDWKHPSKIEWIERCLIKFIEIYKGLGIKSAAFPWMGAMNGGLPLATIKNFTRKYLSNLDDISIEVYDFDMNAVDPLFTKLKEIALIPSLNFKKLIKISNIKARYMEKILCSIKEDEIHSLPLLIESGIIGTANIEKLYVFLRESISNADNFREDEYCLFKWHN